MNKYLIETYHDGYLWVSILGGEFLGRFQTEGEAFAFAYREKCRMVGI
jgi:hypothetical protein